MNLGESIKAIRKAKRMKQKNLAAAAGISANALRNIEAGYSIPSMATLKRLRQALDVPMSYILVFSVTEDDVAEDKRTIFRQLMPVLKEFLLPKEGKK